MVERGNRDLGDMLRSMLLGKDEEDWDLLLPQIMRTIRASPHKQTGETANFMMLGRETRLPEHLMYGPAASGTTSRESYAAELSRRMETAHDKLRSQQLQLRTGDKQEEPSFKTGQLVWLKTKRFSKGQSHKLQPRYTGPYEIKEAARNHTYVIEQDGRRSREAESRLKAYNPAENPAGRIPTLVEPNRQLERKGLSKTIHPSRTDDVTWIRPRKEEETPEDILRRILDQKNASKRRSQVEIAQKTSRNEENDLELRVVPPAKHNSSGLLPAIDETVVVLPPAVEDNSTAEREGNSVIEMEDNSEREDNLAIEVEDNLSVQREKGAEPSQPCDAISSPINRGEEEQTVSARPQRNKRPPAWLGEFITGGELEQSFSNDTTTRTLNIHLADMAQKQLENPPALDITDMWHLSDDEERRERHIPGEGLDICWVDNSTRKNITDLFYAATAQEGQCSKEGCDYSTLSRRKLLDHLVTHFIVYSTDCNYITSRRDSAVKHLRASHGRKGSITQIDANNWRRLRDVNPNLPTSCPQLPMNPVQYRLASRCTELQVDKKVSTTIKRVKVTTDEQNDRPEESPLVIVERKVEMRKRLARLKEDYDAADRLKRHLATDIEVLEGKLAKVCKKGQ